MSHLLCSRLRRLPRLACLLTNRSADHRIGQPPILSPDGPGRRSALLSVRGFTVRSAVPRFLLLTVIALGALVAPAAVPPAEKLLPPDTLFVISAPDWTQLRAVYKKSPQSQFWDDPAMKPFRDKFQAKWEEEFVKPLERDLGVKLDDYGSLLQGQLTFALTQEGWQGKEKDDGEPAFVLLLDTRDKSGLLRTNLAELRKKWSAAGKPIKTEKIRDIEFSVVPLTSNDVPKTLKQFFPQHQQVEELGKPEEKPTGDDEIFVGQYDSLLILSTKSSAAEKVAIRLTGNAAPTLADQAGFDAGRAAVFRDAPLYGWINAKAFIELMVRDLTGKENPAAPNPLPMPPMDKIVAASGLRGVQTLAFGYRETGDGRLFELFLAAPESGRTGLTKLLTLSPRDSSAPAFVPADVVKFQRWRLDGQKAIATLEKMLADISAEALNMWNFILSSGNDAMRANDPNFDLRKNLFSNLGDDFISYTKPPRGDSAADQADPPSLFLVGSPHPDQLAAALRGLLVILTPEGGNPKTREFLGKKIYSVKWGGLPMGGQVKTRTLNYAASGGYVAFSTDAGILEEFLRSGEGQAKPLRDVPGLADAMARGGGQSTGWFSYENEADAMRRLFATLKRDAANPTNSPPSVLSSTIPFAAPEKTLRDWLDFSLLPDYDKVSKYFGFGVYTGSANVDGLTFKFFSPTPPALKQ